MSRDSKDTLCPFPTRTSKRVPGTGKLFSPEKGRPPEPLDAAAPKGAAQDPFGNRAKQFTSRLALGKTITLRLLTTNRYARPDAVAISLILARSGGRQDDVEQHLFLLSGFAVHHLLGTNVEADGDTAGTVLEVYRPVVPLHFLELKLDLAVGA